MDSQKEALGLLPPPCSVWYLLASILLWPQRLLHLCFNTFSCVVFSVSSLRCCQKKSIYFKFIHNKNFVKCPLLSPLLSLWSFEVRREQMWPWQKERALLLIPSHTTPPRGVKLPRGFLEFHRGDTRDPRPVQPPKANSVNVERGDC